MAPDKNKSPKITKSSSEKEVLELGLPCDNTQEKCALCCAFGSGFVIAEDMKKLASHLNVSEEELKQKYLEEAEQFNQKIHKIKTIRDDKPYGPCIFFSGTKCDIHPAKPLHCRLANCNEHGELLHQWFIVNKVLDFDDPECMRQWNDFLVLSQTEIAEEDSKTPLLLEGASFEQLVSDVKKRQAILNYDLLSKGLPHEEYARADTLKNHIDAKESESMKKFKKEFEKKLPEIKRIIEEMHEEQEKNIMEAEELRKELRKKGRIK